MFNATQRGPPRVQTSVQPDASPRASATACDSVGARAPNNAISSASQTAQGRRSVANGRVIDIGSVGLDQGADQGEIRVSAQGLCLLWSMAGMSPALAPGAVVATGTLSSTLVSTPLASLNTSVSGTVLSLTSAAFRSISMTW